MHTLSLSSAVRDAAARKFLDDLSPVGQDPLDKTIVTKAWAGTHHFLLSTRPHLESTCSLFLQAPMIATTICTSVIRLTPR
jgi:hypothetical protein